MAKNYVIVAGGLNTRYGALGAFPKVMLPMDASTSVLCNVLSNLRGNCSIIINTKYAAMLKEFVEVNNIDVNVIVSDNTNGSYNTICAVADELPEKDITFIWSDLIIDSPLSLPEPTNTATIYTKDGDYRFWAFTDSYNTAKAIQVQGNGNVPGIYHVADRDFFGDPKDRCTDLVEEIAAWGHFDVKEIVDTEIKELRDLEAYREHLESMESITSITRAFNSIRFDNDLVTKSVSNPKYDHLIAKEALWYDYASKYGVPIPTIVESPCADVAGAPGQIKMERLVGWETSYEYAKRTCDSSVIEKTLDLIDFMKDSTRCPVSKDDVKFDIEIEFISKTIERVKSIKNILVRHDELLDEFIETATIAWKTIDKHFRDRDWYCFTHGDPNGSNVMCSPDGTEVKFIDPRGYFGATKMAGLPEYDVAKVAYFVSGYDEFNTSPDFVYLPGVSYDAPRPIELREKVERIDDPMVDLMVGMIYINLSSYIANNVMKANIAFEHGLELTKKALERFEHESL